MQDVLEQKYLPDSFIGRAQNACKLLLFKFLLDETLLLSSQKYEFRYVVARMIFDAWPILIERKLSFGIQDKFLSACKHIEKNLNSSEKPSVYLIEQSLKDGIFSSFLNDIKLNFSRFILCWEENCFCPYKLVKNENALYLETRASWIDHCYPLIDCYRKIFYDSMLFFICKRNKNIGDVSEFFKNYFGESIDCSVVYDENEQRKKEVVAKTLIEVEGLNEDELDCLKKIPINFLFQEKDCIGSCTQLLTLEKMHPNDIDVIADVFYAETFKRKWLVEIADFVKCKCSKIISFFNYYNNSIEIPSNFLGGIPLGLSTKMFIEEYIDRIGYKLSLMSSEKAEGKFNRLMVFSAMYDSRNGEIGTRIELAKKYKWSRERIRQLLLGDEDIGLNACSNILKSLESTKNFLLNPAFQADFMQLELSEEYAFPQEQFDLKYGIIDDKTRQFLFDITGWKSCNSVPSYIGPIVFRNCDAKNVYTAFSEVRKILDEKIIPVSLEKELISELIERLSLDNQTINVVCDVIRKSDSFETSLSDDGEVLYALKWQHLCSVPSRLARILYEFKRPMHLREAYAEYNRRAKLFGVPAEDDLNWFIRRSHRYIKSFGRLGMWVFSMDAESEKTIKKDVVSFLEEYIKENKGVVFFDKTVAHLRKSGYSHTEKSIRVYLGNLCRTVKNTSGNVFVYKQWIGRFENLEINPERNNVSDKAIPIFIGFLKERGGYASLCELKDIYYRKTGEIIKDVTARAILDKHNDLFSKEYIGIRTVYFLMKNEGEKEQRKKIPDFHYMIQERIKSILENTDGHALRMSLIARDVCKLVPKEKHSNIVYTIIRNMDDVEMYEIEGKKYLRLKN